jgi:hypothetical protein
VTLIVPSFGRNRTSAHLVDVRDRGTVDRRRPKVKATWFHVDDSAELIRIFDIAWIG